MSRSNSAMDVFNDVRFVRLRSFKREGMYLAADVDGVEVVITDQRNVHNTVWSVDHTAGPEGHGPCVRLRSAYGRYLCDTSHAAGLGPNRSFIVAQVDMEQNNAPRGMLWNVVRRSGAFIVRNCAGRCLRANGKYLTFIKQVTAARDNASAMMLWAIEIVPAMMLPASILFDPVQLKHKKRPPPTERQVTRQIRYQISQDDGSINEEAWVTFWLRTNNLFKLRLTLANMLGGYAFLIADFGICIRAGPYGRLTPLLIDLPIGNNIMDIAIVVHGTPVDQELRYPDLNAA